MNYVFVGLVLSSLAFVSWTKGLGRPVEIDGNVVTVEVLKNSPVSVDGVAEVEVDGVVYPSPVIARADTKVTVRTMAPDGPAKVRFKQETGVAAMSSTMMKAAETAVTEVVFKLIGSMTLFMGLMKVVEEAGVMRAVARSIRPVMVKLFPDVPTEHPAMGAMIMNIAANVVGLVNGATPFGIRAMQELQKLNPTPDTATNAMVRFLAINTSGVAVLPTAVIVVRAAAGSKDPAAIFTTTLLASMLNTVVAVMAARLFEGKTEKLAHAPVRLVEYLPVAATLGVVSGFCALVYAYGDAASAWIIPGLVGGMVLLGYARGVKVYETLVAGAKDGFTSTISIVPNLVAILVAVAMFRASGALERLVGILGPLTSPLGLPPEAIPLALLRPLSGSGAFALMTDLTRTYGPDSYIGHLVGTMEGTSETTFYVLAVYFGSVGITKTRHAVATGLCADLSGVIASVFAVKLLLG